MIDTFSCIHFDLPHLIFKVELAIKLFFSFKEFLLRFKEFDATSDRRSVFNVNVEFALSDVIFDVVCFKINVT